VANAGLLLPATLMQRLGVSDLLDEHVDLCGVPGAANVGLKGSALVAALLAGAKWITPRQSGPSAASAWAATALSTSEARQLLGGLSDRQVTPS
jgi:hypothetical protein